LTGRAPLVGLVDYGMGNRRSVEKALEHIGAPVALTGDHRRLREAAALVVPGVGAFPRGMERLTELGLDGLLRERAAAGVPVLGICLGMQLLFDRSSEVADARGLGLIPGDVSPLRTAGLRVPHIGWSEVRFARPSPLTGGLPPAGAAFYHVHSYAARPADPDDVVGTSTYGQQFASVVARDNVFGVQFHPEKSSRDGLRMLAAFVRLAGMSVAARAA
jgi:glutamine amidotransferase